MSIRIGGAFPFSTTDVSRAGGTVGLAPGQAFYPPAGNYWVSLGDQTILQWWNPIQGLWVAVAQPDTGPTSFNADGYNWRLINLSGVVIGAAITNAGSGAAANGIGTALTGVSVTFAAPGSNGVTALAYPIVGGSVPAPTIAAAGGPFAVAPLVLCDAPPLGGIQATFSCALNAAGGIASVTQQNPGAGYNPAAPPNFYVAPQTATYQGAPSGGVAAASVVPPGVIDPSMVPLVTPAPGFNTASSSATVPGARLVGNALTGSNTLTGIGMISYGSLYTGTTIPAVTVTGCGAATATAIMSMCLTGSTALVGGAGYTGGAPLFESSLGLVAAVINNSTAVPRVARGVATISGGAVNGLTIEDNGFGFQKVPLLSFVNGGSIASGQATATAVVGGQFDVSILQGQVSA